jgi:hypothetical protein
MSHISSAQGNGNTTDAEFVRPAQTMTGFEQTRLSWARRIESFADAPGMFHNALRELGATDDAFPYTVLTPTYEGFLRRLSPKLILTRDDNIYILEIVHKQITRTCFPIPGSIDLELGSILLKSWITLRGLTDANVLGATTLEFNSVTERLFVPLLNQIRQADESKQAKTRRTDFDDVPDITLKFLNYANRSLLPGDHPAAKVWQPEMRTPRFSILGKTWYRTDATSHIAILTPREFILIREDEQEHAVSGTRYGGVWQYVPLRNLVALTFKEQPDALCLTMHLPQNIRVESRFELNKKRDLANLIDAFATIRSAEAHTPRVRQM